MADSKFEIKLAYVHYCHSVYITIHTVSRVLAVWSGPVRSLLRHRTGPLEDQDCGLVPVQSGQDQSFQHSVAEKDVEGSGIIIDGWESIPEQNNCIV
jgi:hypothetical protein